MREHSHRYLVVSRERARQFEAGLQKIAVNLNKPRAGKRLSKLHERIGRLKAKSRGAGQHYNIELLPDDSGEKAVGLRWTQQPRPGTRLTHPGVYCLRSNETGWDSEKLWHTYSMLTDLEAVFRSFKSELGLRPIYHHKEIRVDGHLFITVLACQFVQSIRSDCKNTASKAAGAAYGIFCPDNGASPQHVNAPRVVPCISAKPRVRNRSWRQSAKP